MECCKIITIAIALVAAALAGPTPSTPNRAPPDHAPIIPGECRASPGTLTSVGQNCQGPTTSLVSPIQSSPIKGPVQTRLTLSPVGQGQGIPNQGPLDKVPEGQPGQTSASLEPLAQGQPGLTSAGQGSPPQGLPVQGGSPGPYPYTPAALGKAPQGATGGQPRQGRPGQSSQLLGSSGQSLPASGLVTPDIQASKDAGSTRGLSSQSSFNQASLIYKSPTTGPNQEAVSKGPLGQPLPVQGTVSQGSAGPSVSIPGAANREQFGRQTNRGPPNEGKNLPGQPIPVVTSNLPVQGSTANSLTLQANQALPPYQLQSLGSAAGQTQGPVLTGQPAVGLAVKGPFVQGPGGLGQSGQVQTGQSSFSQGASSRAQTGSGQSTQISSSRGQVGQGQTNQGVPVYRPQVVPGQGQFTQGQQSQVVPGQGQFTQGQQSQVVPGQGPFTQGQQSQVMPGQGPFTQGQQSPALPEQGRFIQGQSAQNTLDRRLTPQGPGHLGRSNPDVSSQGQPGQGLPYKVPHHGRN